MLPELKLPLSRGESDLHDRVRALLDDPDERNNPMREVLEELLERSEQQRSRLEKLLRISDGYHDISRHKNLDLIKEYDRQIVRLEKLARISDRYQSRLLELNQELKELSLRDPLTGIGNRRFMRDRLDEEAARAGRNGSSLALAIMDVDHFKRVNDRLGHDAGDHVLCGVTDIVSEGLRDYDIFARWGGEEFLIVFPQSDIEVARGVCERLRLAIEKPTIVLDGAVIEVTASFGVTEFCSGEDPSETISRADVALRRAKDSGRNRVEST